MNPPVTYVAGCRCTYCAPSTRFLARTANTTPETAMPPSNSRYTNSNTTSTLRPNTPAEQANLTAAAAAGKKIEVARRVQNGTHSWAPMTDPRFNFMDFQYRIAKVPARFFALVSSPTNDIVALHRDEAAIDRTHRLYTTARKVVLVEEVK